MPEHKLISESIDVSGPLEAIEEYYRRGWTDGLPVVPPTADAVQQFLFKAGLAPNDVLGIEPTKGAVITAEKAAINAVASGCLPEYMGAIVAAIDAITTDKFNLHAITNSTMGAGILLIINGPLAKTLDVNSGTSVFGPGRRANATIGRAIRLIVINVLGTKAGGLDKATQGHPGKYTWCMAENDRESKWDPLHVTRGFDFNESTITTFAGLGGLQVGEHEANAPEPLLSVFAKKLLTIGADMHEVLVVICPEHAAHLFRAGWSKNDVSSYLFEQTAILAEKIDDDQFSGTLSSPEAVVPILAGGSGGGWSSIIPAWGLGAGGTSSVTRKIKIGK